MKNPAQPPACPSGVSKWKSRIRPPLPGLPSGLKLAVGLNQGADRDSDSLAKGANQLAPRREMYDGQRTDFRPHGK